MARNTIKLDSFDLRILQILQEEGRITKLELSQRIARSQTPCHERVKRLEKAGNVRGYHADVDINRLLPVAMVFVTVTLERHKTADFKRFEAAIKDVPEIMECYALGGGIDYLLTIVAHDLSDYQRLIEELLNQDIGIAQYFTYVVTKKIKKSAGFPILHLAETKDSQRD